MLIVHLLSKINKPCDIITEFTFNLMIKYLKTHSPAFFEQTTVFLGNMIAAFDESTNDSQLRSLLE